MASDSDDLERALQQNLEIRRVLGAEIGKVDGIQPAKRGGGMVYRLGWVLYWCCLLLAGIWVVIVIWLAMTDEGGIGMDLRRSPITDFIFAAPSLLLYGLGRAFRYVLSGE